MRILLFTVLLCFSIPIFSQNNGIELIFHTLEYGEKGETIDSERHMTIWILNSKLKIASNNDKDPLLIFDSNSEILQIINRAQHDFIELTKSDLKELDAQLEQSLKLMEEKLSTLPESQKEAIKSQFYQFKSNKDEPEIEYKNTEINKSVESHSTLLYEGWIENEKLEEIYVADYETFEFDKKELSVYNELMDFIRDNTHMLMKTFPTSPAKILKSVDHPSFKEGIPVKTVNYNKGIKSSMEILKSSRSVEIPSEAFDVPPGFKKKDIMEEIRKSR